MNGQNRPLIKPKRRLVSSNVSLDYSKLQIYPANISGLNNKLSISLALITKFSFKDLMTPIFSVLISISQHHFLDFIFQIRK